MTLSILVSIIVLIAASVGVLLLFLSKDHYMVGAFKIIASTGYVALCIAAGGIHSTYGWIMLTGFVLAWWGDLFLISKTESIFLIGLITFFLSHVAYSAAFIVHGTTLAASLAAFGIMLIPGIFVGRWLYPHLGKYRIPVLLYMLMVTIMVSLAAGSFLTRGHLFVILGAGLFYCSDLFVGRRQFLDPGKINQVIGLPLYYIGQILLALSVMHP
jgi:uncharacterized membrane protein YhhN